MPLPAVLPVVLVKILFLAVMAVKLFAIGSIGTCTFSNTLLSTNKFASKPAITH